MVFSKENASNTISVVSARPLKVLPVTAGLIVLLVVVVLGPSLSQAMPLLSPGANRQNVEFKRYCSSSLSDIMFSICGGNFNSLFDRNHERESESALKSGAMKRLSPDADEELFYRPMSMGPVHECCRRPCGYTELKLYCSQD